MTMLPLTVAQAKAGDFILTGINAQAFVSRAIKLGSVLRFQPKAALAAQALRWIVYVVMAVAIWALLTVRNPRWPLIPALLVVIVGGVLLALAVTWIVATIMRDRDAFWGRYSHSALVVEHPGTGELCLAEALSHGVTYSPLDKYPEGTYTLVQSVIDDLSRMRVSEFAREVVEARSQYGFVTFASLGLYCVTGAKLTLGWAGTAICSGFVAGALAGAGPDPYRQKLRYTWERPPEQMMPANLASHCKVE